VVQTINILDAKMLVYRKELKHLRASTMSGTYGKNFCVN